MVVMFLAVGLAKAEDKPGTVRGSIVTIESDGARRSTFQAPRHDRRGAISKDHCRRARFIQIRRSAQGQYQIRASARGWLRVGLDPELAGQSVDVQVVMEIEALKESVTVNGNAESSIATEPEQRTEITSTVLNAPTKDDRADTLLPLIPEWFEDRTASSI
jgi:hypothetical protein